MSVALLDQWTALADSALRAVESGDAAALRAALEERERVISEFSARGRPLDAATAEGLLEVNRTLEAGVRRLQHDVTLELSEVRVAREKLRARSRHASEPILTSRRA